ncbi:hypothetical protein CKO12_05915 [Chromatium okenii]|uniref:hypothetical protein n=1 Tax=Chromatium okenii TaxID=61644 RepID=UPI0019085ED9|nr:hypothetical protein [Chromatium okenii]MBK1641415.1 hypothetical protein [Chromatium okenii]
MLMKWGLFVAALALFTTALVADERVLRSGDWGAAFVERDGVIYPAIKGTSTPDYGARERLIIRDGKVYEAIPGTTTPDYGSGRYLFQNEEREDD